MTKILIGISDVNNECKMRGYRNWIQWMLNRLGHDIRPDWEHPKGKVLAGISKKKWYVKCPYCPGVSIGVDEHEAYHFCIECLNIENDFKPQIIKFPNIKKITELMALRPDYRRRNYIPHHGETLKDIEVENKKYGWSE